MQATQRRSSLSLRLAVLASGVVLAAAQAHAQTVDCYDRALPMPKTVTQAMAESCHRKIIDENTTNDRHAIALYNAARLYNALGDREQDATQKITAYDKAVADLIESRDRAADANMAFANPWRKGDKRSQAAQMAQNRFFLADRSYQLGKAFFELARAGSSQTCPSREACFERAANELEQDAAARAAGAFRNDYVYLRANVYIAWGQSAQARRDLEFLKDSPAHAALATQRLGEMFLADAVQQLVAPLTVAKVQKARLAYKAATGVPSAAIAGQLGLAETFLLEAHLVTEADTRRALHADAVREFDLAVSSADTHGSTSERLRAHEGRGTSNLELARGGDARALARAIDDLQVAAGMDTTFGGASAQLKLARALALAGRAEESNVAYAEAERRFGSDPQAAIARAELSFERGKRFFASADHDAARGQFLRALAETGWQDGRADAFFFLSAIDLRVGGDAVAHADAASAAGGGGSPYREQACLARIAAGGQPVQKQTALPACAGSDVLTGMFYLRHAQLVSTASAANDARKKAQDAFMRARASDDVLRASPDSEAIRVSNLATFGSAVALGCSTASGINIPVDLDAEVLEKARAFFVLHRVHACVASR